MSGRLSRPERWKGAPEDPPVLTPQLQTKIKGDRLRLVEDGDGEWISAGGVLALEDCR